MSGTKEIITGLALLREPFPENLVGKLPKPTRKQTDEVKNDFTKGIRCKLCGAWHHKDVAHIDYIGHAALTDRLLDCDQEWNWDPVAVDEKGLPSLDATGGMWIKLTVCGVTRLGYGDAEGKTGGNAVKERIGDALRNAAMRFGAALDLWHKGDLHAIDDPDMTETPPKQDATPPTPEPSPERDPRKIADGLIDLFKNAATYEKIQTIGTKNAAALTWLHANAEPMSNEVATAEKAALTRVDPASQGPDTMGESK